MTFIHRPRGMWLAAIVLLLYAAMMLARAWRLAPHTAPAPPAPVPDTASDRVVSQALGQIPGAVDSTALKTGWRDEVPGIDLDSLTAPRRELLLRVANSERCTCGCGFTLAACRTFDTTCPVSGPRVRSLRDSVVSGLIRSSRDLR